MVGFHYEEIAHSVAWLVAHNIDHNNLQPLYTSVGNEKYTINQ